MNRRRFSLTHRVTAVRVLVAAGVVALVFPAARAEAQTAGSSAPLVPHKTHEIVRGGDGSFTVHGPVGPEAKAVPDGKGGYAVLDREGRQTHAVRRTGPKTLEIVDGEGRKVGEVSESQPGHFEIVRQDHRGHTERVTVAPNAKGTLDHAVMRPQLPVLQGPHLPQTQR